jgi:transposase-like protein
MDDLLRIYVHPEKTSHVYVVHTDLKEATLLSILQQKVQSSTLVIPSLQNFYRVDGKSDKEIFTIIVSPDELPEVSDIFKTEKTSYLRWVEVEKVLIEKGKIDLSQEVEKPFAIAGNVRGWAVNDDVDPFASRLQIFSGKSVLVKKYEFRVKK